MVMEIDLFSGHTHTHTHKHHKTKSICSVLALPPDFSALQPNIQIISIHNSFMHICIWMVTKSRIEYFYIVTDWWLFIEKLKFTAHPHRTHEMVVNYGFPWQGQNRLLMRWPQIAIWIGITRMSNGKKAIIHIWFWCSPASLGVCLCARVHDDH